MQLNIYRYKQRNRKAENEKIENKLPVPEQNVEKIEMTGEQDGDPVQDSNILHMESL